MPPHATTLRREPSEGDAAVEVALASIESAVSADRAGRFASALALYEAALERMIGAIALLSEDDGRRALLSREASPFLPLSLALRRGASTAFSLSHSTTVFLSRARSAAGALLLFLSLALSREASTGFVLSRAPPRGRYCLFLSLVRFAWVWRRDPAAGQAA